MAAALSGRSVVVVFILLGVASVASSKETTVNIWDLKERLDRLKNGDNMLKAYRGVIDEGQRFLETSKLLLKNQKSFHRLLEAGDQFLLDLERWTDDLAEKNTAELKKITELLQALKKLVKVQQSLKGDPSTEQILKILKEDSDDQ